MIGLHRENRVGVRKLNIKKSGWGMFAGGSEVGAAIKLTEWQVQTPIEPSNVGGMPSR